MIITIFFLFLLSQVGAVYEASRKQIPLLYRKGAQPGHFFANAPSLIKLFIPYNTAALCLVYEI